MIVQRADRRSGRGSKRDGGYVEEDAGNEGEGEVEVDGGTLLESRVYVLSTLLDVPVR